MIFKLVVLFILTHFAASQKEYPGGFSYIGFGGDDVTLDGTAQITPNGLLMLTNKTKQQIGHAFHSHPLNFVNPSTGKAFSFSTTFVFVIIPQYRDLGGHGMAFVIAPSRDFPGTLPSQYMGLFNKTNIGKSSNYVIAVEFDTIMNLEFNDINENHVGININDMKSVEAAPASYFINKQHGIQFESLSLVSGECVQVWVEYDGVDKQLNVTIAPLSKGSKPAIPLLSLSLDLSPFILENMFVGFSASTGSLLTTHYLLGWSFQMSGKAQALVVPQLPMIPPIEFKSKEKPRVLTVGLPVIGVALLLMTIFVIQFMMRRKRKFAEVVEEWELDYGPQRFKYKDLYTATKGFKDKDLVGRGGFGSVYRGVLPNSNTEVAVKRVSHESRQGMREFVAEIASLGQLRHRNLLPLLGYCRRKRELLLVYDFMPNGSLDKFLFNQSKIVLNWSQRFRIIKGVASGLFYLHEESEQVVVHRDVKSSNVLLDRELNGRLGDFGLARLYNHGTDPQTTRVVGTIGYLAPEFTRNGKATPSSDVFAFGAFMLEVACGRRPLEPRASFEVQVVLVDWVFSCWSRGSILETVDPKLGNHYMTEEMELVLKLGLLCSHCTPTARPSMRQVVQYLDGQHPVPELLSLGLSPGGPTFGFDDVAISQENKVTQLSSVADSLLSGGR